MFAHRAIEDEVDSVVRQSEDVDQISEVQVHFLDERPRNSAQDVRHSLRKLRHEKEGDDDQQHSGRSIRLPVSTGAADVSP